MKAFERQYKILKIINEKGNVTVEHLANELEISKRTILRDITDLSGFLPIRTMQGRYGGGISFIDGYRYCDYQFYMIEEQVIVLNKIIYETRTHGFCKLTYHETEVIQDIMKKYSPISYVEINISH